MTEVIKVNLQSKSVDRFLYDRDLRHERDCINFAYSEHPANKNVRITIGILPPGKYMVLESLCMEDTVTRRSVNLLHLKEVFSEGPK